MNFEQASVESVESTKTTAEERREKDINLKRLQGLDPKRGRVFLELAKLMGATDAQTFDVFINTLSTFPPKDVEKITKAWQEVENTTFNQGLNIEDLSPKERKEILDEVVSNVG